MGGRLLGASGGDGAFSSHFFWGGCVCLGGLWGAAGGAILGWRLIGRLGGQLGWRGPGRARCGGTAAFPHPPSAPPTPHPPPKKDFIGVSGYAPLTRPLDFSALEISWETAAYELGLFGISVKDLAKRGKKLIYRWGGGGVWGARVLGTGGDQWPDCASGGLGGQVFFGRGLSRRGLGGGLGRRGGLGCVFFSVFGPKHRAGRWAGGGIGEGRPSPPPSAAPTPKPRPALCDAPASKTHARKQHSPCSEHGLGGCYYDYSVAPDLKFVKEHPWLGYWPNAGYDPKTNPWLRDDYRWGRPACFCSPVCLLVCLLACLLVFWGFLFCTWGWG